MSEKMPGEVMVYVGRSKSLFVRDVDYACHRDRAKYHHDDKLRTLEAEVERLRSALSFYADKENYMGDLELGTDVQLDEGQRAREALEGKPCK